ncbi:MAG TPA: hypothetical protein VL947_00390, partial [Cytophagales bacterium]|nr:hypothetical protein [Cytophagales bacterium]
PQDEALISCESNPDFYVQWGLIYNAGHPFLKKTLEVVMDNLIQNRFPHDVHKMTGPAAYSQAIRACLAEQPNIPYRLLGVDYNGYLEFSYPMSKLFLNQGAHHWKKAQAIKPVLKA